MTRIQKLIISKKAKYGFETLSFINDFLVCLVQDQEKLMPRYQRILLKLLCQVLMFYTFLHNSTKTCTQIYFFIFEFLILHFVTMTVTMLHFCHFKSLCLQTTLTSLDRTLEQFCQLSCKDASNLITNTNTKYQLKQKLYNSFNLLLNNTP